MTKLFASENQEDVRAAIRKCLKLLARADYESAVDFLVPLPERAEITESTLKDTIARYSRRYREASPGERDQFIPRVMDPDVMDDAGENLVIYPKKDSHPAIAEYDLPLDGKWSDLTVKFAIVPVEKQYALGFLDMRVL
jgi:hypothetical protein